MTIHGTMYAESRDRTRLLSVRDAALQALVERCGWASISDIHARVEQLTGRKCREDSPRRMLGYIHEDADSAWDVISRPNPDAPGTAQYRAMRRVVGQQNLFAGVGN